MKKIRKYKQIRLFSNTKISNLVHELLREIDKILVPLFEFINSQRDPELIDHFNRIRVLVPLLEVASFIEFEGNPAALLDKLAIPEAEMIWGMFRDGLSHSIRPYFAMVNKKKIAWAVPCYDTKDHYKTNDSLGIDAPKLLRDFRAYLEEFKYNQNIVKIQTSLEFITCATK